MSADDTNNNNSSGLIEKPEHSLQSNNIMADDDIIIGDDSPIHSHNNNNDKSWEESVQISPLLTIEEPTSEKQETELENIITENEIINNIKHSNNPIAEFNSNLLDNIKTIVTLFGNQQETLIVELNRFITNFSQKNIEEIQYLKVKNHVLQELIVDMKAPESSPTGQNGKEEAVILELSKMRHESSKNRSSSPSPETNEYMHPPTTNHSLISGTSTNNPQRRTRRIRKKPFTEPVHKVRYVNESTDEEDETQKTDEQYSSNLLRNEMFRRMSSVRMSNEILDYPSSDAQIQLDSDDEDETENEYSTPEKPKRKKKKKNSSDEDDDYIPKQTPRIQTRSNISNLPPKSVTPSSNTLVSTTNKPVASSATNSNPPPVTGVTFSNAVPNQPAAPKRRGRPRRVRPEDTAMMMVNPAGLLGKTSSNPVVAQGTPKGSLDTATNIQKLIPPVHPTTIAANTADAFTTAPQDNSTTERPSTGAVVTGSSQTVDATNNNPNSTSSTATASSSTATGTASSEMSSIYSRIPPNMKFDPSTLQPGLQVNPTSINEFTPSSFPIVNNQSAQQIAAQNLLGQKKRGPKPGATRRGARAMFTIYDSNSFKLTYEKPGVTKITKASVSGTPHTVFIDADVSQYAELSNAVSSLGSNSLTQFGNVSETLSRPNTTEHISNSNSSNNRTTPQSNAVVASSSNVASSSSTTITTESGGNSVNSSSSKTSRRFTSHASNSNLNDDISGSPTSLKSNHNTGILVMNPTSSNMAPSHPYLVTSTPNKKIGNGESNTRDYYAQTISDATPSKDGSDRQDNTDSVTDQSVASKLSEDEPEMASKQSLDDSMIQTASLNNAHPQAISQQQQDQNGLPPPIVRIRLAPQVEHSSSGVTSAATSSSATSTINHLPANSPNSTSSIVSGVGISESTIEERKKLFSRRVRKV